MAIPYEKILPKKEEARFLSNHGRILGSILHIVDPIGKDVCLRLLPTSTEGEVPQLDDSTVWANVFWGDKQWVCMIMNLPAGKDNTFSWQHTMHDSLKSAMRKARKAVGKHATEPQEGWQDRLQIVSLENLFTVEEDYDLADEQAPWNGGIEENWGNYDPDEHLGGYDFVDFEDEF